VAKAVPVQVRPWAPTQRPVIFIGTLKAPLVGAFLWALLFLRMLFLRALLRVVLRTFIGAFAVDKINSEEK
jgi:hypothetical protein